MADGSRSPELSVVVAADRAETIGELVGCLDAQTARDRVELVVVALGGEVDLGDAARDLAAVRVVPVARGTSLEAARAVGVRAASAPVVLLGETHSFPRPGFAAAILEAHRAPCAAVVPALGNANPGSAVSWANLLLDYGPWLEPPAAGEVERVPDHNCSYKRELVLAVGEDYGGLEALLEARSTVGAVLRARGHRLLVEPAARLEHLNVTRPRSWLHERYLSGRILGGTRSVAFSPARRLAYLLASPAVPALHLLRARRVMRRLGLPRRMRVRIAPPLVAGSLVWTIGEAIGYAVGIGGANRRMVEYEVHKRRHAPRRA